MYTTAIPGIHSIVFELCMTWHTRHIWWRCQWTSVYIHTMYVYMYMFMYMYSVIQASLAKRADYIIIHLLSEMDISRKSGGR